jgi:hypothetical protein
MITTRALKPRKEMKHLEKIMKLQELKLTKDHRPQT